MMRIHCILAQEKELCNRLRKHGKYLTWRPMDTSDLRS